MQCLNVKASGTHTHHSALNNNDNNNNNNTYMPNSLLLLKEWAVLSGTQFLTLILPSWRIWWAPNNASKWQMGFNSAFKGLMCKICTSIFFSVTDGWYFDTEISISGWLSENLPSKSAVFAVGPQFRGLICLEKDCSSKKWRYRRCKRMSLTD